MNTTTPEAVTEIYGSDLNHWLAAIGITQLVDGARLSWRGESAPVAVIGGYTIDDLVDQLVTALPTRENLDQLPLARYRDGFEDLTLNPTITAFRERSELARRDSTTAWTWTSLYAAIDDEDVVVKSPFLTAMPSAVNTPWDRLVKLADHITPETVHATLVGDARRVEGFGWGIDIGRIASPADDTTMTVDPVMEMLAFHGLALFPMRVNPDSGSTVRQRGWREGRTFRWPNWKPAIDISGIDAFLDMWIAHPDSVADEVSWAWESVRLVPTGKSLITGYASRPIRIDSRPLPR